MKTVDVSLLRQSRHIRLPWWLLETCAAAMGQGLMSHAVIHNSEIWLI